MTSPFWNYLGGKAKFARRYPPPKHSTIVEPFAGAAGYSLLYAERNVILVELYPVVAEVWRYLIRTSSSEIMKLPVVDHIDELPSCVPEAARYLIGLNLANCDVRPRRKLSAALYRARALEDARLSMRGWSEPRRERTAKNATRIKHWRIIEGEYTAAPDLVATWFIDPPYKHAKTRYMGKLSNYEVLATWCLDRIGQVIVCEGVGANWLPFAPFGAHKRTAITASSHHEALWYAEDRNAEYV